MSDKKDDLIISGKCSGCGKPATHEFCKKCMDKNKVTALEQQVQHLKDEVEGLYKKNREAYKVNVTVLELERMVDFGTEMNTRVVTLRFHDQSIGTAVAVGNPPRCWEDETLFRDLTDIDSW